MALALYRKYRPRRLDDLLGQEANVAILKNAARQGKIGHAYLFYGPRGTGKTTTARLLAKLLNCVRRAEDAAFRAEGEPCNKCVSCKEIDEQRSLAVLEIDAASNRGIDEIRNLKEEIRAAPVGGRYRVYIVDEVHMLTGAAFNALLKTLEEPPAHAVFILATTEYEKLPPTITSRTQRFLFKRLPKVHILEKLTAIAAEEKINIDRAALELVAASGEGSVRDAESLLDQLSSTETKITLEVAERLLGRTAQKKIEECAELILGDDLAGSLALVASLAEEGVNVAQFTKDLIHYFRKLLSLAMNPSLGALFRGELTDEEAKRAEALAKSIDAKKHVPFLKSLIRAYGEIRYSPFASVPLEIAIIEHLKS